MIKEKHKNKPRCGDLTTIFCDEVGFAGNDLSRRRSGGFHYAIKEPATPVLYKVARSVNLGMKG